MRYRDGEELVFQTADGRSVRVYDMREIDRADIAFVVDRAPYEAFDLIASRPDVYGEGGERSAWKLHDAMAVELSERRFDYSLIRQVRVPE